MTQGKDTATTRDDDLLMLQNVMRATGLPRDIVEGFLMTDNDLDELCDTVLAKLAVPEKKIRTLARPL